MNFVLKPWQLLLLILAGWINRHQQDAIEYLMTENQVLREKLGKRRILLNDDQRRRSFGTLHALPEIRVSGACDPASTRKSRIFPKTGPSNSRIQNCPFLFGWHNSFHIPSFKRFENGITACSFYRNPSAVFQRRIYPSCHK